MIPSGKVQRDCESEPSMNCRKRTFDVETGGGDHSGISKGGDLKTGSCGIRLEGGVNLDQALIRNAWEPVALM
jgi:hypothetical protein